MKVNLYVRDQKEYLNYHFTSFTLENEIINFHIPTLLKEVSQLTRKEKKQYKKIITSFLVTAGSIFLSASKSMANGVQQSPLSVTVPATTLPTSVGLPPELMEIMSTLLVITTGAAVMICIGMLVLAGILRAMRKRKESSEWTVDIVKGLVQVIMAAPVVFLIYYIATILFGGSTWFVSPFVLR